MQIMKHILTIIFSLLCITGFSQVFQTNNQPVKFRGLIGDSINKIPAANDTPYMVNPKWGQSITGALYLRLADTTLWAKVGSRWQLISGGGRLGGDTTIFEIVLDSTGQPQRRLLFSGGNNKISSSPKLLVDSANTKIVIGNENVSVGGTATKLWVSGRTFVGTYPQVSDTGAYKPLVGYPSGGTISVMDRWPTGGGSTDTTSLSNRINLKLNISDTAAMLANYLNGVGLGLARSGQVVYGDTASNVWLSRQRAANTYEPIITSGTTAQYWRGDKSWRDFNTDARAAISLTTTGTSGAATYNNTTGVINVPQYETTPNGGQYAIQYYRNGEFSGNQLFVYDTVNRRIGFGITVPTRKFHMVYSNNANEGGIYINNTSSGSAAQTSFYAVNNTGAIGGFGVYSSGHGESSYRNNTVFGSSTNLIVAASTAGPHSGSGYIEYRPGGRDSLEARLRIYRNGSTWSDAVVNSTPDPSAVAEFKSTSRGILIPRMTTTQQNAISSPATGLMLVNTDSVRPMFYNGSTYKGLAFTGEGGSIANYLTADSLILNRGNVYQTGKGFSIRSGWLDSLYARTSTGLILANNSGSEIARFGNGGGTTASFASTVNISGQASVGSSSANSSAQLDVSSTTRGFLPPRMTNAQMQAISSPVAGLIVFNTDSARLFMYNGTVWGGFQETKWANATLTGADVTMTTAGTYYTGTSVTVPDGTWEVSGNISVSGITSANIFTFRIYDGTNSVVSGSFNGVNTGPRGVSMAFSPRVITTTGGSTTLSIQATSSLNGASITYRSPYLNDTGAATYMLVKRLN